MILAVQHAPFEGLGQIESWLEAAGFDVQLINAYDANPLPDPTQLQAINCEGVVLMGGPMSVHDRETLAWLDAEIIWAGSLPKTIPVLGVCLGAQILAIVHSGNVVPGDHKEIGWFPIERVDTPAAESGHTLGSLPDRLTVCHWHGEQIKAPQGATVLYRSEACPVQAFSIGGHIGLQFHLEMNENTIEAMINNCGHELVQAPYIQTAAQLRTAENFVQCHTALDHILQQLFSSDQERH